MRDECDWRGILYILNKLYPPYSGVTAENHAK
jgi:hypothetical protein